MRGVSVFFQNDSGPSYGQSNFKSIGVDSDIHKIVFPVSQINFSLYLEGTYEEHVYSQHIRYEMPPPHSSSTIIVAANQSQPLRHRPFCPIEFWNISERVAAEIVFANSAMEMAQLYLKVF